MEVLSKTQRLAGVLRTAALVVVAYLAYAGSAWHNGDEEVAAIADVLETEVLDAIAAGEDYDDETTSVTTFPLGEHAAYGDLWVAYGLHDDGEYEYNVVFALYARPPGEDRGEPLTSWYNHPNMHFMRGVKATPINVGSIKDVIFSIDGIVAIRNCDAMAYRFDGEKMYEWISHTGHCTNREIVNDLNGDGIDELLFFHQTSNFRWVSTYEHSAELAYWNGMNFVLVHESSVQDDFVRKNAEADLALRMIEADLWVDAAHLSKKLSNETPDDMGLRWWSVLIEEIASRRIDNVSYAKGPFLAIVFTGNYAGAFEMMRMHPPEATFSQESPLLVGIPESLHDEVVEHLLDYTERALAVRPDDPHIFAVRALALALDGPEERAAALGALARAAELAPDVEWLRQARHIALRKAAATLRAGVAEGSSANELIVGGSFRDCSECPEMVLAPTGSLPYEQRRIDGDGPVHGVTVSAPFAIGRYEVTVAEFGRFVDATGYSAGRSCWIYIYGDGEWESRSGSWRNPGFDQSRRFPVVCVSWNDARAYVAWLSRETGEEYRLPSESEWEYTVRTGTSTGRYWGEGESGQCRHANLADARCVGNVLEWTDDCWNDKYGGAPSDGDAWEYGDCARRVVRGGSWFSAQPDLRTTNRVGASSGYRNFNIGFRVARTLAP